jgi:predicted nucleic acid-binding protein
VNFLLDTNVVSNLRKAKPHPLLVDWLSSIPKTNVFMASPTITELQCGVGMAREDHVAKQVQTWLDGMIAVGDPQVLPFGTGAALLLGRMWTRPSLKNFIVNDPRAKKAKSGADLTIAACAIASDLILATENVADFKLIHAEFPLPGLYNPFENKWYVDNRAQRVP